MIELAVAMTLVCLAQAGVIAVLIFDRRIERQETREERATLIQRILAPEIAAIEHYNDHIEPRNPPAVVPDDDEDFWKARQELDESREELAERLAAEELGRG